MENKGRIERVNGNGRHDIRASLHGILDIVSGKGSDLGDIGPKDIDSVRLDVDIGGINPDVVETRISGRIGRDMIQQGQDARATCITQGLSNDKDQSERNPYRDWGAVGDSP